MELILLLSVLGLGMAFEFVGRSDDDDDEVEEPPEEVDHGDDDASQEAFAGTDGDDFFVTTDYQDYDAGDGEDTVRIRQDSTVHGGDGDDKIRAHADVDQVRVYGEGGDDLIGVETASAATVHGGRGTTRSTLAIMQV